jgi:hypothetical protein
MGLLDLSSFRVWMDFELRLTFPVKKLNDFLVDPITHDNI